MDARTFFPVLGPVLGVLVGVLATYLVQRKREFEERQRQKSELFYERLLIFLNTTQDAFNNQRKIVNLLVEKLEKKNIKNYENPDDLLTNLYFSMNEEELYLFQLIRGITENTLFKYNSLTVKLLEEYPQFYNELPEIRRLHSYLNLWLDNFNSVFRHNKNMCMVNTGVVDSSLPREVNKIIKKMLEEPWKGTIMEKIISKIFKPKIEKPWKETIYKKLSKEGLYLVGGEMSHMPDLSETKNLKKILKHSGEIKLVKSGYFDDKKMQKKSKGTRKKRRN